MTFATLGRDEIKKQYPWLIRMADNLQRAFVDFLINADSKEGPTDERVVKDDTEWEESTAISSLIRRGPNAGKHILLLDLDCDHVYVPSSTPGHGHLIVNEPMDVQAMLGVLDQLSYAGIIEEGFAKSARHRGAAWLRLPWVKKSWGPTDPGPDF